MALLVLGIILVILWLLGFLAFHIASWVIHLVLVVGVILFIIGLIRRGLGGASTV